MILAKIKDGAWPLIGRALNARKANMIRVFTASDYFV
jgi:hypothetical protein